MIVKCNFKFCRSLQTSMCYSSLCRCIFSLFDLDFLQFNFLTRLISSVMSRLYSRRKILVKIYSKWVFRPHPLDFFWAIGSAYYNNKCFCVEMKFSTRKKNNCKLVVCVGFFFHKKFALSFGLSFVISVKKSFACHLRISALTI